MEHRGSWIEVRSRAVFGVLVAVSGVLVLASFAGRCLEAASGCVPGSLGCLAIRALDVQQPQNLSAWWSGALLLGAALLALGAAAEARKGRRVQAARWAALAGLSALGSLDQSASLHDRLDGPVQGLPGPPAAGIQDAWIIPGALVVTTAAVAMLPLLDDVSRRVRRLLLASFVLFLSGALGVETMEELLRQSRGHEALGAVALATLAGLIEMLGEALLVGTLLLHLRERAAVFRVAGAGIAAGRPGTPPLRVVGGP